MGAIVLTVIIWRNLMKLGRRLLKPLWKGTRTPLYRRLLAAKLDLSIGKGAIVVRVDACRTIVNAFRAEPLALICVSAQGARIMN